MRTLTDKLPCRSAWKACLFHDRDYSLLWLSNAPWHPILCLCGAEKLDSLRWIHSTLTRRTHCAINVPMFSSWLCCSLPWRVLQVTLCRCLWKWQIRILFIVLISNEPYIWLLLNMNLNSRICSSSELRNSSVYDSFQPQSCYHWDKWNVSVNFSWKSGLFFLIIFFPTEVKILLLRLSVRELWACTL